MEYSACKQIRQYFQYENEEGNIHKGYQFDIRNAANETIGILFGTVHDVREKDLLIDSLVTKNITRAKKLFVETSIFDVEVVRMNLQWQMEKIQVRYSKDEIKNSAKCFVDNLKNNLEYFSEHPSVDMILEYKALELGIPIHNLEIISNIEVTRNIFDREITQLRLSRDNAFKELIDTANNLVNSILSGNELKDNWKLTILAYKKIKEAALICNSLIVDGKVSSPAHIRLFDITTEFIERTATNFKLGLPLSISLIHYQNQFDLTPEKNCLVWFSQWKYGEEDFYDPFSYGTNDQKSNEYFKKSRQLDLDQLISRDKEIVKVIDNQLRISSPEDISFYALGSDHLKGNYDNVIVKLREKGWKIFNSYTGLECIDNQFKISMEHKNVSKNSIEKLSGDYAYDELVEMIDDLLDLSIEIITGELPPAHSSSALNTIHKIIGCLLSSTSFNMNLFNLLTNMKAFYTNWNL